MYVYQAKWLSRVKVLAEHDLSSIPRNHMKVEPDFTKLSYDCHRCSICVHTYISNTHTLSYTLTNTYNF